MLRVNINGQVGIFPKGTTILAAARKLGFSIPTLCHDDRIGPVGACRLCVVQVRGAQSLLTACSTPLADGMEIETDSEPVIDTRAVILQLLAQNYPKVAVANRPEKPFHKLLAEYRIEPSGTEPAACDDAHAYIHVDLSKCVRCFRCVRVCEDAQGQFVWQIWNRGSETAVRTAKGKSLAESGCVSCGGCVDVCPTGALEHKSAIAAGDPDRWTRSVCAYCGVGCEILIGTRANKLVQIKPFPNSPVNRGHLCVKGRYAFEYNSAADRILQPMVRCDGVWGKRSWFEAVHTMAKELSRCVRDYGPDSVGVLSSARGTNEESYLAQKFARLVLGTNNVDCCARVCHAPTATAMSAMLGTGAATNSFADIEQAGAFLVCGCNPTENHPIVGERIKQRVLRGAGLVVIDPRKIELTKFADVHLALKPGSNVLVLNALAATILDENLAAARWLEDRVTGLEDFSAFIRQFAPERIANRCGVPAEEMRRAARVYARAHSAMAFHGLGVTEHRQGSEGVQCLVNLALLTGNLGRIGSGVNPLRGQNNVQGAAHMGCEPNHLAGYATVEAGRSRCEEIWGAPLPTRTGLDLMQMIDAAAEGRLKALWAIGYDIALTNPDSSQTAKALQNLEFLAVQDLFLNETAARHANLFLPAASSFERDGTFMNSERRVQRVRAALLPPGEARADWRIICDVARAMGNQDDFNFDSPAEIWNEIRELWTGGFGMTYDRLDRGGIQWPCPDLSHAGTAVLHTEDFNGSPKARLALVEFEPSLEQTRLEFPILLSTGRTLMHFNAGTMTMRTRNRDFRPTDTLDLSPDDADALELKNGEFARVTSEHGETTLPIRRDERVKRGEAFATFHSAAYKLNRLIGPGRDEHAHTPEYKVVAVQVAKAG